MTITIAQHTGSDALGNPVQNPTISYANAQTAGNLNVVIVGWTGAVSISSVTDSQGNSYSELGHASGGTTIGTTGIWYCLSIGGHAAGNVVTIHFSANATNPEAWLIEANTTTGTWSAGPFDSGTDGGTSSTAMTCAGVNVTSQPTLGVAAAFSGNGQAITAGTGWTGLDALSASDQDQWKSISATGTQTATASQSPNPAAWAMCAGYFYTAASSVPTKPWTWYPDAIPPAPSHRLLREAGIFPSMPPIAPTFAQVVANAWGRQSYPDRAPRPQPNAALAEEWEIGEPPIHPTFAEVVAFAWGRQSYPERVLRATMLVGSYWMYEERPNLPERTATYLDADFPDVLRGPLPRKDYFTEVGQPERTFTYIDADFPEVLRGPLPPRKDYWTEVGAPELNLPSNWYTSYPERTRAGPTVAQQRENAWIGTAVPERTSPYFSTSYPERFPLGGLPVPLQQQRYDWHPFTPTNVAPTRGYWSYPDSILPAPRARTLSEWSELATPPILPTFSDVVANAANRQSYPDRALRAVLPTAQQPYALDLWPLPIPNNPAPTVGYWSYPDQVLGAPPRKDYTTTQLAPERTAPIAATVYQDQIIGAPPRSGYFTEVGAPEAPVSLDWYTSYPELTRSGRPVAQQQAFASPIAPERTAPLVDTRYPDAFARPVSPPVFTLASPLQPPAIATVQFWTSYPDSFPPRAVRAIDHLAWNELSPLPRPNIVTFEAFTVYPDSIPLPPRFHIHATWSQGFLQLVATQIGKLVGATYALTGFMGSTYALPNTQDKDPALTGILGSSNT